MKGIMDRNLEEEEEGLKKTNMEKINELVPTAELPES
jgi:hypothetical protein